MASIRVVSGGGRYTDPWHPFAETSPRIAAVADQAGHRAEVAEPEPAALADLGGVDLVVINAGGNPKVELAPDPAWEDAFAAFGAWIDAGHPVLGVHTASNAFPDWPEWNDRLGGRWVRGTSMHPPRAEFTFSAVPDALGHPALGGLESVTVTDERYSYLDVHPGSTPLLWHRFNDADHVMAWARETPTGRLLYDGLGHDAGSYDSPDRCRLLTAEIAWLLAG